MYFFGHFERLTGELKGLIDTSKLGSYLTIGNGLKLAGSLAALLIGRYTLKLYLLRRKYAHIPGPPADGLYGFFMGNVIPFNEFEEKGVIFSDYLLEWHQKFGPVIKVQFLDTYILSIQDPLAIKDILIVKNYPKMTLNLDIITFPLKQRYLGYGLVTDPDNISWKHQRSIYNPGFHRNVLMSFINQFNTKADILMERLRSMADGKSVIKLFPELNHTTLDAIAIIAFGMNTDSINGKDSVLNEYISLTMKTVGNLFRDPFFKYKPSNWKKIREFKRVNAYLRNLGKEKIMERMKTFNENENTDTPDILTSILRSAKVDSVDFEVMIDNFLTFFIAGQETTANTLAFCFLELAKNPQIIQKCRDEIDQVLGSRTQINHDDISKLKYVSCVFKESLRLYPPATEVSRALTEEMEICGYRIPKNSNAMFSTYVSARTESNFPNCLEFKPERFLKDPNSMETSVSNYTYFPFSLGPRSCIGQNFAQIEGIVIIARLLQAFDVKIDLTQSMKIGQDLTIKPVDGTRVILSPRA